VITLVGNFLLIPFFEKLIPGKGYLGCAITNFTCYLAMVIISYYLGQKYYPINYPVKRILFYLALAMALVAIDMFITSHLDTVLRYSISSILFAGYIALAYILEKAKKIIP